MGKHKYLAFEFVFLLISFVLSLKLRLNHFNKIKANFMIICIANTKGGSGKSLTALNLIKPLNASIVVDLDNHEYGTINDIISRDQGANIKVVNPRSVKELDKIFDEYDDGNVILVDCAGVASDTVLHALSQADYVLTPTKLGISDMQRLINFNKCMISAEARILDDIKLRANVFVTDCHHKRKNFSEVESVVENLSHLNMMDFRIQRDTSLEKAAELGKASDEGTGFNMFQLMGKQILKEIKDSRFD